MSMANWAIFKATPASDNARSLLGSGDTFAIDRKARSLQIRLERCNSWPCVMLPFGTVTNGMKLVPNEQITHITLWCLLAAPLLIGCDMSQMDPFTIDLLSNDEVLDVDQDPLGKAATRKAQEGSTEVWTRPLADGTMAVGLFNRGRYTAKVTAKWTDLGLSGQQSVRDLWRRTEVGTFEHSYTHEVRAHGAALVKIGKS